MGAEPLLVDPDAEHRFTRDGHAIVPFLGPAEVAALRRAYHRLVGESGDGMVVDYTRADRDTITEVEALLAPVWARHLPEVFVDHRPVFSTFVVKYPGPSSSMFLHDDRSFVDERRHRAGTLWIPLVDTAPDLRNGCLHLVPGSQRLALTMAGTATPELFRPYEPTLARRLVPVPMKAGDALVYDTRVLHSSPANLSDQPREAVVCALAPREAELIHVVAVGRRRRHLHRVDEAFYLQHSPQSLETAMPTAYPVIEAYDDEVVALEPGEVDALLPGPAGPTPPPQVLVPPDLVAAVVEGPTRPASEVPVRVGSLVAVDAARGESAVLHGMAERMRSGVPLALDEGVPAALTPMLLPQWSVGDPRARVEGDDIMVALRPGQRLCLGPLHSAGARAVGVLIAPPAGAGLVSLGHATQLEPGDAVVMEEGDQVLWNHGPGPLVVLIGPDASPGRPARPLRRRVARLSSRARRDRRLVRELEAASGAGVGPVKGEQRSR